MRLGVAKDGAAETRVAVVPASVKKLKAVGFDVRVESGAGTAAGFSDAAYVEAGATIGDAEAVRACDVVVSLNLQPASSLARGTIHVCVADPFRNTDGVRDCLKHGIQLLSLDLIPRRLSRAQSMDVNSSQDSLAGYRAVLLGAAHLGKVIPMMTTSAGTVRPARFVIMGSGVAGLQAIATARRLGAVVYASDVRLAAKEQIESVGGRFILVDGMEDSEDASGYAKPLTPAFIETVNNAVNDVAAEADVVITTARIFGRRAPITIPADAVARYKPGAVIVDMNADVGGNCALTQAGIIHTTDRGVIVVGLTNLPGQVADTASTLFSNNLTQLLVSIVRDGALNLDPADPILTGPPEGDPLYVPDMGGVLVCQDGALHSTQARLAKVLA
ncbi:MAG: NAD(P) transhydrogenase subunit alpha [Myxococcota bacterium]|jgi:NAD(P) transhydrogenase subunit alpha